MDDIVDRAGSLVEFTLGVMELLSPLLTTMEEVRLDEEKDALGRRVTVESMAGIAAGLLSAALRRGEGPGLGQPRDEYVRQGLNSLRLKRSDVAAVLQYAGTVLLQSDDSYVEMVQIATNMFSGMIGEEVGEG